MSHWRNKNSTSEQLENIWVKLTRYWESNWQFDSRILLPPLTQVFRSKWLIFFFQWVEVLLFGGLIWYNPLGLWLGLCGKEGTIWLILENQFLEFLRNWSTKGILQNESENHQRSIWMAECGSEMSFSYLMR